MKNAGKNVAGKEENARLAVNLVFAAETMIIPQGMEIVRLEQFKQLGRMAMIVYNQKKLPVRIRTQNFFDKCGREKL